MPQISRFLGVNSVTNIELPEGFMPAFICIFVDWLETLARVIPPENFPHRQATTGF